MLPAHGKINCRDCFSCANCNEERPHSEWKIINQPAAYGGQSPEYLVLGFSKGATQQAAYENGKLEEVAFAGMRPRLSQALQQIGVLSQGDTVDRWIADPGGRMAFGSLVRCSVSRKNGAKTDLNGNPVYSTSGSLINKSFREIPEIVERCTRKYLTGLPRSLKAVFLLGNDDKYVENCQTIIRKLYPNDYQVINPMGSTAGGKYWIHLAHPSPANGHFSNWLNGQNRQGEKMRESLFCVSQICEYV